MRVQFLKKYRNYVAGQFYTIDPKTAKGLIAYGICIEIKEEIEQPEQPEQPEQVTENKRGKNKK